MFANERQNAIVSMLQADGAVTVGHLTQVFHVSLETIRRDLLALEKQNVLQRVHGGAVLPGKMTPISRLEDRIEENKDGKLELSRTAANLVDDGDVIYIDSGATARYFARALAAKKTRLTVVTNSQDVFQLLHDKDGFSVILCGGHYMKEERVFYGYLTQESLRQLYVDKAFIAPSTLSLQSGAGDFSQELVILQKLAMSRCNKAYLLADSQKFERSALYKCCDLDASVTIVTDSGLSQQLRRVYEEKGIHIITGKERII